MFTPIMFSLEATSASLRIDLREGERMKKDYIKPAVVKVVFQSQEILCNSNDTEIDDQD